MSLSEILYRLKYLFNVLWNTAFPAQLRVKEIEEGIIPSVIEFFSDPIKIQELYIDMIKSATKEIMLIIPTKNGFYRQSDIGVIRLLSEKAITSTITSSDDYKTNMNNNEIKIRLLSSLHDFIGSNTGNGATLLPSQIQFQNMESTSSTKSTILIVDQKEIISY